MFATLAATLIATVHLLFAPAAPIAPTVDYSTSSWDEDTASDAPPAFAVTADDGTVTVNRPQADGTVSGTTILPGGASFEWGTPATGYDACSPVHLQEGMDYSVATQAGWSGKAGDGMEALYAPGC